MCPPGEANAERAGEEMFALARELYPICRSITGDGMRRTLCRLQKEIPLQLTEVPTGTQVFDWTVPKEWNIRDAYVKNTRGERVIDFQKHTLHVVNYSVPIRRTMTWSELKPHLFTLPDRPDWIPYRTSYYKETWGFCLAHRDFLKLGDGDYEVCIDSTLEPGHLTLGELLLPGETTDEVLFSCHACHPSLADDNLSGIVVAVALAKRLASARRRYSYRFLFVPGTIGSITWLARNEATASRIRHGLVLTCLGDAGAFNYKKSRRGSAKIDRAMQHVLRTSGQAHAVQEFFPYGYDERQYCSPGFNLPVGCLMRSQHGKFPEYHTSADNLDFIKPACLAESLRILAEVVDVLENNRVWISQNPKCEPQLGRRGLYSSVGGARAGAFSEMAMLWVLNLADGTNDLLAIAERANLPFADIRAATQALAGCGLLKAQ